MREVFSVGRLGFVSKYACIGSIRLALPHPPWATSILYFLFDTHCVPNQKRTPIPAEHSTQRGLCEVSVARRSVPTILSIHTLACQ
jgi:hypothetical protein